MKIRLKCTDDELPLPEGPFSGEWCVEWPSGIPKFRADYVNGIQEGLYECYGETGILIQKGQMKDGNCIGHWVDYHPIDGHRIMECDYDGSGSGYEGVVRRFWNNGTVSSEKSYHKGVPHGSYREFDSDGNIMWEGEYRDGDPWEGICQVFDFGGVPRIVLSAFQQGEKIRDIE
jgi:antitoxin component YwqK of YwqJK toxin-antitoxin module